MKTTAEWDQQDWPLTVLPGGLRTAARSWCDGGGAPEAQKTRSLQQKVDCHHGKSKGVIINNIYKDLHVVWHAEEVEHNGSRREETGPTCGAFNKAWILWAAACGSGLVEDNILWSECTVYCIQVERGLDVQQKTSR